MWLNIACSRPQPTSPTISISPIPAPKRAFYCTQLIYLAYLRHGIDFNTGQGILGLECTDCFILPQEIWDGCSHRRLGIGASRRAEQKAIG